MYIFITLNNIPLILYFPICFQLTIVQLFILYQKLFLNLWRHETVYTFYVYSNLPTHVSKCIIKSTMIFSKPCLDFKQYPVLSFIYNRCENFTNTIKNSDRSSFQAFAYRLYICELEQWHLFPRHLVWFQCQVHN